MQKRIRADEKKIAIIIQKVIEDKRLSEVETGIWNRYDDRQCKEECLCSLDVVAGIDEHWKEQAYPDHVNGGYLEASKVLQARKEEMAYVYKYNIYEKVDREDCKAKTGKPPIRVRWVDTNKGFGTDAENYRSRLVAMEFKRDGSMEYFSATPPLETLRILLSSAASRGDQVESDAAILYLDVRRAYFHAKAKRDTYIELPLEDDRSPNDGKVGKLNASMYGTRDAADNWSETYGVVLKNLGFKKGVASPCVFVHVERGIKMMVHGDDFLAVGNRKQVYWIKDELKNILKVKSK